MVGYKQEALIKKASEDGQITTEYAQRLYGNDKVARAMLEGLQIQGFIKHKKAGVWIWVGKE